MIENIEEGEISPLFILKNMEHYFSSDYHLGHHNVIKYDNRPFKDIYHMNETIIENHNSRVSNEDEFYFLGDFALCRYDDMEKYLSRLNGKKFFIKGNHDKKETIRLYQKYGTYLGNLAEIKINNQHIVICHYAMKVWNKSHHGTWHLYGHSHHSLPEDKNSLSFDVGINGWDYMPISFKQIENKMSKKTYKPKDHHV